MHRNLFRTALAADRDRHLLPAIRRVDTPQSACIAQCCACPAAKRRSALEVAQEQQQYVLYLINGAERTRVSNVKVADGELTAVFPGYENSLRATMRRNGLEGSVTLIKAGGKEQVIPFTASSARRIASTRDPLTDNADVGGTWDATFTNEKGETSQGDPVARTTARPRDRQRHDAHRRSPLPRRPDARRRAAAFDFRRRAGVSVQAEGRRERRAGRRLLAGPRVARKGCRATQRGSDARRRRQADHPARQQAALRLHVPRRRRQAGLTERSRVSAARSCSSRSAARGVRTATTKRNSWCLSTASTASRGSKSSH